MELNKERINERLGYLMEQGKDGELKEAMGYAVLSGGKRLRPLLMLSVIESYGVSGERFLDVACALEMVHTYSLIHDDLPAMDDDDLRRGKASTHRAFNEATAILAGDALLTDAFSVIVNAKGIEDSKKVEAVRILSEYAGSKGMVYGQILDMFYQGKEVSKSMLEMIHEYKTARLIQASLMMGALFVRPGDVGIWEKIGANLGLAFQLQDDLLELTKDEGMTGKSFSDVRNDKKTAASILGIETAEKLIDGLFERMEDLLSSLELESDSIFALLKTMKERVY